MTIKETTGFNFFECKAFKYANAAKYLASNCLSRETIKQTDIVFNSLLWLQKIPTASKEIPELWDAVFARELLLGEGSTCDIVSKYAKNFPQIVQRSLLQEEAQIFLSWNYIFKLMKSVSSHSISEFEQM